MLVRIRHSEQTLTQTTQSTYKSQVTKQQKHQGGKRSTKTVTKQDKTRRKNNNKNKNDTEKNVNLSHKPRLYLIAFYLIRKLMLLLLVHLLF